MLAGKERRKERKQARELCNLRMKKSERVLRESEKGFSKKISIFVFS